MPIGDTWIGWKGKKCRVFSKGAEGHAQAAVGEGVQHAVGGGGEEEVEAQRGGAEAGDAAPERQSHGGGREGAREEEGVALAAVPQQVLVGNAERERRDVGVRQGGIEGSEGPDPLRNLGAVEAGSQPEGGDGMGEDGRHGFLALPETSAGETQGQTTE